MPTFHKVALFLLRVTIGWMFFYAGITKVLDPAWSAAGYLTAAQTFGGFYLWLASPNILPVVNFLNAWGLTLIGVALLLGVYVRLAAVFGSALMILYWLPLGLPHPNPHSFIVDEHLIYIAALATIAVTRAGRVWGLEARYPALRR